MPNTITYTSLSNVLPNQRLLMYQRIFNTTTPIELHGTYIWSVKVAAAIQPLLSTLEVALRNSIHTCGTQFIAPNWYEVLSTRVRTQFNQPKRDRANIQWHHSQVTDTKRKLKTPPNGLTKHDLLVAKMDFGFWDNLLRECFSVNGDTKALWPQCTSSVFPNLPSGYTNATVQSEISKLRDLRNDIAHNSPVWKVRSVIDEQSAILYLNQQIDKIIEVIGWLSTDKMNWIQVHMLQAEAKRIATKEYLYLCQRKNINPVSFSRFKRDLRKQFKNLNADNFTIVNTNSDSLFMLIKMTK